VIKRIRLIGHSAADDHAAAALAEAAIAASAAPLDVRPARIAVCVALPDVLPDPRFGVVGIEWFRDVGHLERFASWLAATAGTAVADALNGSAGPAAQAVLVAHEHALRGADWLERRWREGGTRLKHMAIARRADGLTPAQFAERWRNRAGRVGAVRIPERAAGLAYVQNHPLREAGADWPYDAVNEVYFDDVDGLKARIAWFTENFTETAEDDLVGESWFVAVREEVLWAEPRLH
jgi:hypothetical protein